MKQIRILNVNKLSLCCGNKNCPEVELKDDGLYYVTDDFGGSIRLTADQFFKALPEALVAFGG